MPRSWFIFSSLLTIGGSFAKNLNLLAQKEKNNILKVLANEKRGGWRVELFDRFPFKLFLLKFSIKLVQAPFCKRHKTEKCVAARHYSVIGKQL
jgi:hypothetical protein